MNIMERRFKLRGLFLMSIILTSLLLNSCGTKKSEKNNIENFTSGLKAKQLAEEFAEKFPKRTFGSQNLSEAGTWLVEKLSDMGYEAQRQAFSIDNKKGENIVVKIRGRGFFRNKEDARDARGVIDKNLVIGAFRKTAVFTTAYDVNLVSAEDKVLSDKHQGIHNNAAAVGILINLARELKNEKIGHDVILVFTSGSHFKQQGARTFLASLSEEEQKAIDVAIDLRGIYAGEKLYFHAGRASVEEDRKYELRRKLYLMVDLFSLEKIYSLYDVNILTTQNSFNVNVPNYQGQHLYREFSLNDSDYLVFDELKIPVVFFDSGNYYLKEKEAYTENNAAVFSETKYLISGTNADNIEFLAKNLSENQLVKRSQALSTLLLSFLRTGLTNAGLQ